MVIGLVVARFGSSLLQYVPSYASVIVVKNLLFFLILTIYNILDTVVAINCVFSI